VTTATRRLRRAGVAGLATIATAGVTVLASGGTALAFVDATNAATGAVLATAGAVTVTPGTSGQSLGNITVKFPANGSASEFSAGEQMTFVLTSDGATLVNDVTSSAFNTAAFAAAPTVSVDNGVTAPGATVALASVDTATPAPFSGVNNAFTVTFTQNGPQNSNATTLTISGLKVSLGSGVSAGQTLSITASATTPSTAKPFWNGAAASNSASVDVATLPQIGLTTSAVAVGNPTAGTASLGDISIKVLDAAAAKNGDVITLTLDNGATWATAPTASGTPSVTVGAAGAAALTVTLKADSAVGNTIVLKGAKITGAGAGAVTAALTSSNATLTLAPSAQVAAIVTQARLGGADRYGTASLVFNKAGFTSSSVILTSGTNFPDALSAQYLAKALSTAGTVGILTTDPNNLTGSTKTVLTNGTIDTVYIVGGTAAVSANVANQVAALHVGNVPINANLNVIRIAGADRYATNNAADLYLGATGGTTHAYIATGANFADALAIGPVVYKTGDPLILTDSGALNANAKSTLQSLGITDVTIVGGTSAVSTAVETALTNMGITIDARLAGADRTQTAAAIANDAVTNQGFDLGTVYIARGDSFADALVAGPLAGLNTNPILLTSTPTTLGAGIPSVLSGQAANVTTLTALGLTGAVSVGTLNAAAASLS